MNIPVPSKNDLSYLLTELDEYVARHYKEQPHCACNLSSVVARLRAQVVTLERSLAHETTARRCLAMSDEFATQVCSLPESHGGPHAWVTPSDEVEALRHALQLIADGVYTERGAQMWAAHVLSELPGALAQSAVKSSENPSISKGDPLA